LLKIFFGSSINETPAFEHLNRIDISFCLGSNKINFNKFERINPERVKEIITGQEEKVNNSEFNLTTKLFFSIQSLMTFCIGKLDEDYHKIQSQFGDLIRAGANSDPRL
jgi:hypothetical protein